MKNNDIVTLQSIYEGRAPHRLHWTLGKFDPYQLPGPQAFHLADDGRRVFGNGNSRNQEKPFASRGAPWLTIDYAKARFAHAREGDVDHFRWETPQGRLTARRHSNHMIEFPLKSVDDLPRWQYVQENLVYRKNPEFTEEQGRKCWSVSWKWSPVQEMLQFETGVENFYYFLMDAPDRMRALLDTMHRKNLEGIAIGLNACPKATVLMLTENTSSQIISPDYYRDLTLPHVRKYVEMAHARTMKCVVHMCGSLTALFDEFEATGMDGIHSVTPPPVGDTEYMAARERFGDDFIILGRFSAQLFINRDREAIRETLCAMIPERLIHTPFALQASTDEMQPGEADIQDLVNALQDLQADFNP